MYEINVYQSYSMADCGRQISLTPCNQNDRDIKSETLDEFECELPDGFCVAKSVCGTLHIYDSDGNYCPISHQNGIISIVAYDKIIKIGEWEFQPYFGNLAY